MTQFSRTLFKRLREERLSSKINDEIGSAARLARSQQIHRVQRALRSLFVFEVGENIAASGKKFKSVEDILEEIYRAQQK